MEEKSAVNGIIWKTMEQYGVLGIQFVLQVILARILEPSAYGVIAIVSVFIALSNVFIQNGFSVALVQRKNIDIEDISSVFFFSLIIAAILYSVLFFSSPFIARFFNMPELRSLLRVMSLCLFPQAYSSIQNALLRRQINFKAVFISSIVSVSISGLIAIVAANKGFGVWALAIQQMIYSGLVVITQFYLIRWRPVLSLNLKKMLSFFSFGWKVLVSSLVDELFTEIRSLIIGKFYSSSDLSFFNRGKQYPNLLMRSLNGSLQAVLLPKLSQQQNNASLQHGIIHKSLSVSAYVMFPILTLLAASATPLVTWMLTEKWLPCVIYIQLHCLYYATWPITTTNIQALFAIGKSGVVMTAEILRKVFDIIVLLLTIKYGVIAIAIGAVAVGLFSIPIYVYPSQKYVGYKITWQIKDIAAPVFLSIVAGCVAMLFTSFDWNPFFLFCVQICVGLVLYVSLSWIFNVQALKYLISIFKSKLKR